MNTNVSPNPYWRICLEASAPEEVLAKVPNNLKILHTWPLETGLWAVDVWGPETALKDLCAQIPPSTLCSTQKIPKPGYLTTLRYSKVCLFWTLKIKAGHLSLIPSKAFGSGTHPTTTMLLELLDELWQEGQRPRKVLDLGAGSGILSLVAAKLFKAQVYAVEIDPWAASFCQKNIRLNHFASQIHVICGTCACLRGPFDLIVANIYLRVLMQEATQIISLLAPKGILMLSGFLEDSSHRLCQKYAKLALIKKHTKQGWEALWWQKK